ncbi:hypothetical protein [Natrarchaeobius chitinivorans]|uniref:hypothetical protein n=1 Tax=Natrarchaeobius chitinivorans TaxID=1679083 RepID=UPI000F522E95|nr:hypothetical protein [Natrarchaeobius chitinivorans]
MKEGQQDDVDFAFLDDVDELIRESATRPPTTDNYLSESRMRYLLHGETGSYSDSALEEKVNERANELSVRIRRLLYDITALEHDDRLSDIDDNWNYLPDVSKPEHWSMRNLHGRDTKSDLDNSEFQLGFSIGLALSTLTGTVFDNRRAQDFLSGFTLAYHTDDHYKEKGPSQTETNEYEIADGRAEVLERYDIKPTPYLDEVIHITNIGLSEMNGDPPLRPREATERYVENRLGESFGKYSTLRLELDEEWNSINEASVPGINVKQALETLWNLRVSKETGQNITSETIALAMGKSATHKRTVSNVFNNLSEEGKSPSNRLITTYKHREVVYWSGQSWKFTDYGKALAHHVFRYNQNAEWIQKEAIGVDPNHSGRGVKSEKDSRILDSCLSSIYS